MLHSNLNINDQDHLEFAGVDAVEMADKYGTPLYLMDENRIRERCREYIRCMQTYLGENSHPLFASKACSFKQMYRIAKEEGMFIDVVSGGELHTAVSVDYPAERIFFHGNYKSPSEIRYAMEVGLGYIVVDNPDELHLVDEIAAELGIRQKILLRITPGVDAHTNKKINTGLVDSKFGATIETGHAEMILQEALACKNVDLRGFHCHVGSQIFTATPFMEATDIMIAFCKSILNRYGFAAEILNLGGGLGVRYIKSDPTLNIDVIVRQISEELARICKIMKYPQPAIFLEPGRSIVADSGITLYTVGSIKQITDDICYVAIDGGMTDNPRYTLYQADHTFLLANRMSAPVDFKATIAGRCCESGDVLKERAWIPKPEVGDKIATLVTGAYNYSMASNYNRIPRAPVVMIRDKEDYLAVKRESYDDLLRNDV